MREATDPPMIADTSGPDGSGTIDLEPDGDDRLSPLEALLELPRSAGADPLAELLPVVAETIAQTAGFETVVVNLYRPAWDDYEVALILGPQEARDALLGATITRRSLRRVFAEAAQPLSGLFFLAEDSDLWTDLDATWTPELHVSDHPDAWRPGDGLVAFISDSLGEPLAFISMDEPSSQRRPSPSALRLIHTVSAHTAQALESVTRREAAAEHARMLSLLLETSPALAASGSPQALFELAAQRIVPALGFERFAAYLREGDTLRLLATRGDRHAERVSPELSAAAVDALLASVLEQGGCYLGDASRLFPEVPLSPEGRSNCNGEGAAAWQDHCLLVPCRLAGGELLGIVVVEDPSDCRLPSLDRRRVLRLLADQVAGALAALAPRWSSKSPTPSRRALDDVVAVKREVALLVCELDLLDPVVGPAADELPARFGELLWELARASDVPMRLAGEEFCVVLPGTDRAGLAIDVASAASGVLDARVLLGLAAGAPRPTTPGV